MSNSKLTAKQVKHVAKLANLTLTEEEVIKFQEQLSAILAYFEKLKEIDTTGIEPTSQVTGLSNILREDKVDEARYIKKGGYFRTKAIFE